ncbi:MAG: hypothetical protein HWD92_11705 [Flavobacteriia bacterium]|nr:hypothetical protein [Flavobacteriia bacterium]
MKNIQLLELRKRVQQLVSKNGYAFSDEDLSLLKEVLNELDVQIENSKSSKKMTLLDFASLTFKLLKFFGFDNFEDII